VCTVRARRVRNDAGRAVWKQWVALVMVAHAHGLAVQVR
jgi:hypothetical protein